MLTKRGVRGSKGGGGVKNHAIEALRDSNNLRNWSKCAIKKCLHECKYRVHNKAQTTGYTQELAGQIRRPENI